MQRIMLGIVVALALLTGGCNKHVIRDAAVYQTELTQYDNWATKQADLLAGFMAKSCTCVEVPVSKPPASAGTDPVGPGVSTGERKFTTPECSEAADYILTIRARHEWHMQMSLYNGELRDKPPASPPPVIPPSSTLCPTSPAGPGGVQ